MGIDRYHSPDNIPEGMASEIKNMDPQSNGQLVTRKGFEQYYGEIPLRASAIAKSGTTYTLEFDSATNLANVGDGPIVVAGLLPSDASVTNSGDFRSDSFQARYYDNFDVTFREIFTAADPGTITKTASATGIEQQYVFVGWHNADSTANLNNTVLTPADVRVNTSNFTFEIDYQSPYDINGFVSFLETPSEPGTVFIQALTAESSKTIPASTHNLNTTNFIVRVYETSGSTATLREPAEMTINNNGDLTVELVDAATGYIIMYAADATNIAIESAVAGPQTFTISGVADPFNFVDVWYTVGTNRINATPESITWDESAETLSIGYVGPSAENVEIYWQPANFVANSITFTDTGAVSETYGPLTEPEICLWGISHNGIYRSAAVRGGFTHHIDNYKAETKDVMVAALGGNLYEAASFSDAGTTYKMRSLTMRGSNRVSGTQVLGPLFGPTGQSFTRTRGNVLDDSITDYATITDVTYDSGSGYVDYTFTFDSKSSTITLGSQVSTNDLLTVVNCGRDVNNGSFDIVSIVSDSATQTVIRVDNPNVSSSMFDETGISASGNVFTDQILMSSTPVFVPGDIIASGTTSDSNIVKDISGNNIYVSGITGQQNVPDGINLYVKRTSSEIPLQRFPTESVGTNTNGGFVRGDSLVIGGISNSPKIININTNSTTSVSISVSSGVATVTKTGHKFNVGQTFTLYAGSAAGVSGTYTVSAVLGADTYSFDTTLADGAYTATLQGKTVEIDESVTWTAGPTPVSVTNVGRWVPVEIPKSAQDKVPETKTTIWDESDINNQPYCRSVVVNDSMFFVNNKDEVKKYNGVNITNAGIEPWQGGLFLSVDNTTDALGAGESTGWDNGASNPLADGFFLLDTNVLSVGDRFKTSTAIYTVKSVAIDDSSKYKVYVAEAINASDNTATGTITRSNVYRYYVRVNAVDVNRNTIASAMLGADDLYVETFDSAAIDVKVANIPAFDELDHDRLEMEIYRTKRNQAAPFYLVHRKLVDYDDLSGYIVYKDTDPDETLVDANFDEAGLILGGELGNTWSAPPLASAITTADNRLVLGNIKSPPTLDVTFRRKDDAAVLDEADFHGGEVQITRPSVVTATSNNSYVFSFESSGEKTFDPTADLAISTNAVSITGTTDAPAVGSWVYFFHDAPGENNTLDFAGWYRVNSSNGSTSFSVQTKHSRVSGAGASTDVNRWIKSSSTTLSDAMRVPVWIGDDGNLNQIFEASAAIETRAASRLGAAINSVMAADNATISYWTGLGETPNPWLSAQSGLSYPTGSMKITLVDDPSGTINFKWNDLSTDVEVFVNNVLVAENTDVASEIRLFNSRLAISYPNYPEIFDDPFSVSGGDGITDVNPADGQEITAVIPFFGQSAFGAANLAQAVVVFKTSSVYLVDLTTGQIQKLQTQGQGCTAPRSVALTRDGIIFANESGLYRLGWDMRVEWIGRMANDLWKDDLDLTKLANFCGHNFKQNRQYKLSVTVNGAATNSNVLVYDHTREAGDRPGAWTEYTNHSATGWANQANDAYFGNQTGQVMQIRNNGDMTDFRDDASPVADQTVTTGAIHYGLPGNRKVTGAITLQYQNDASLTDVQVSTEQSLSGTFNPSTQVDISATNQSVKYALPDRRGTYLRVKITKAGTKDEQLQVSRMTCHVKDIGSSGTPEAAKFST